MIYNSGHTYHLLSHPHIFLPRLNTPPLHFPYAFFVFSLYAKIIHQALATINTVAFLLFFFDTNKRNNS